MSTASATALKPKRAVETTLPVTLAMATPAVRMVVVEAWSTRNSDGTWDSHHDVVPVLALVAYQTFDYSHPSEEGEWYPEAPTHRGMLANGWRYRGSSTFPHFDVVIHDAAWGGLINAETAFEGTSNFAHEVVVCPWPPEEDETRLAPVVARLKTMARDLAEIESPP